MIGRPKLPKSRQTLADKKFQWPLPRIPIDDYFSGKITHVDDAGQIYLQPLSGAEELLEMEKKINKICKGITKMSGRQKPSWNVGDICLAKYPNLNWWSRGQVIAGDAQMSEVPILFVDYGEVKYLNPENGEIHDQGIEEEFLRMPMQMLRCQLDNIAPLNGVYTTSILEWLHKSIFDQEVDVKITRTPTKFPLPVIIKLKDEEKTNPARLLVKAK